MLKTSDFQEYAEQHAIFAMFSSLLQDIAVEKPAEPLSWIIAQIKKDIRRIIIVGAPMTGKGTQAEKIAAKYGVIHISTGDLMWTAVKQGTPLGKQAQTYMQSGTLVPDEIVIKLVKEKLAAKDVRERGWLLDGFPRTGVQANAMKAAGIIPTHVILLDAPESILMDRAQGRRLDPVTGKIYHIRNNPPPSNIASRCVLREDDKEEQIRNRIDSYNTNAYSLTKEYNHLLVKVNCNDNPDKVFQDIDRSLSRRIPPRTEPKRAPRIILKGAPNSGKATLSDLLVKKFKVVPLSLSQIIERDRSGVPNLPLPSDAELLSVVTKRLTTPDVISNGYVLTGYPNNAVQIAHLQNNSQTRPSHTIFIDLPKDELINRQTKRFFNPTTGEIIRRDLQGKEIVLRGPSPDYKPDPAVSKEDAKKFIQRDDDKDVKAVTARIDKGLKDLQNAEKEYKAAFKEHDATPIIRIDGTGPMLNVFERLSNVVEATRVATSFATVTPPDV
ncbi:MAG: adenylate kinase [Streblomastix strix]|uniref:Adenylate kinase n=1 Tax=Streblomastix strix TaxID=222440 RepID=A0A5J4VML5_9EUKA|nr:MAG: adenylate kinase [Streblomastix strix]